MNVNKFRTVASFEFLSTVKRKGYLITTFGMPLFVLMYAAIAAIPGYFISQKQNEVRPWGVVDQAQVLTLTEEIRAEGLIPSAAEDALRRAGNPAVSDSLGQFGSVVFSPFATPEAANDALVAEDIDGYYVIPADYIAEGKLSMYKRGGGSIIDQGGKDSALRRLLRQRLLEGRVSDDLAQRIRNPISSTQEFTIGDTGQLDEESIASKIAKLIIPILFAALFFTSLMMTATYLTQAVAIEKENRVVEVLLSSARPEEILFGKLLGLGAAGLLQMAVWFGFIVIAGLIAAGLLAELGVDVPFGLIGLAMLLFILGYLFLGSLMLGTGSLGGNVRESGQLNIVWTMLSVTPFMLLGVLMTEPNGIIARVLTFIPFSTPLTVLLRKALGPEGMPAWEVALAVVVLVISTWFGIKLGAKLFRIGLLMKGTRPKLREIWRQARLSN